MKNIIIAIGISLLAPLQANAGTDHGNGGDAVVCRNLDGSIQTAELLDFYEARLDKDLSLALDPTLSTAQNLNTYFSRLSFFDTYFRDRLQTWYITFNQEAKFVVGETLVDIPDSNHNSFPTGCKVEQVAIQKKPDLGVKYFYKINKDIWDKLDSANQAGLIIHELLYKNLTLFARQDHYDSRAVRYFNGLLASDTLKAMPYREYVYFINAEFMVELTNIQGRLADIQTLQFYDDQLIGYELQYPKDFKLNLFNEVELNLNSTRVRYFTNLREQTITVGLESTDPFFIYNGMKIYIQGYLNLFFDLNTKKLIRIGNE